MARRSLGDGRLGDSIHGALGSAVLGTGAQSSSQTPFEYVARTILYIGHCALRLDRALALLSLALDRALAISYLGGARTGGPTPQGVRGLNGGGALRRRARSGRSTFFTSLFFSTFFTSFFTFFTAFFTFGRGSAHGQHGSASWRHLVITLPMVLPGDGGGPGGERLD